MRINLSVTGFLKKRPHANIFYADHLWKWCGTVNARNLCMYSPVTACFQKKETPLGNMDSWKDSFLTTSFTASQPNVQVPPDKDIKTMDSCERWLWLTNSVTRYWWSIIEFKERWPTYSRIHRSCTGVKASFKVGLKGVWIIPHFKTPLTPL
jgi:hypothetical protein